MLILKKGEKKINIYVYMNYLNTYDQFQNINEGKIYDLIKKNINKIFF